MDDNERKSHCYRIRSVAVSYSGKKEGIKNYNCFQIKTTTNQLISIRA